MEAYPAARNDAMTTPKFLIKEVYPRFGIPDKLSSNNGVHFVNGVIQLVAQYLRIKRRLRCIYQPK